MLSHKSHMSLIIVYMRFTVLGMLSNIRHVMSWGTLGLGSTDRGTFILGSVYPWGDLKLEVVY